MEAIEKIPELNKIKSLESENNSITSINLKDEEKDEKQSSLINTNFLKKLDNKNQELDCECPVCWRIMIKPSRTPCNHFFCYFCLKKCIKKFGKICPSCRSSINYDFKPKINIKKKNIISQIFPEKFLLKTIKKGPKRDFTLNFGIVFDSKNKKSKFFLKLFNKKFVEVSKLYISSVKFLTKKIKGQNIIVKNAPFNFLYHSDKEFRLVFFIYWNNSKIGSERFKVDIDVIPKKWFSKNNKITTY